MPPPTWYERWLAEALHINERRIFFVGGCQKSGTTWVQRLLDAHPRVACGGEGHAADLLAACLKQAFDTYNQRQAQRPPDLQVLLDDQDLLGTVKALSDRAFARSLARADDSAAIAALGDKTPEHACHLDLLEHLYPGFLFIHVIRDGRDACTSGWFHLRRQGKAGNFPTMADYARYFATNHWIGYANRVATFAARHPGRVLDVRYESLHERPAAEMARLLQFLGATRDEEEIDHAIRAGSFRTLTGGRSQGEEDTRSFFRKGVVGDWRERMDADAVRAFESIAGERLRALGYEAAATATFSSADA